MSSSSSATRRQRQRGRGINNNNDEDNNDKRPIDWRVMPIMFYRSNTFQAWGTNKILRGRFGVVHDGDDDHDEFFYFDMSSNCNNSDIPLNDDSTIV